MIFIGSSCFEFALSILRYGKQQPIISIKFQHSWYFSQMLMCYESCSNTLLQSVGSLATLKDSLQSIQTSHAACDVWGKNRRTFAHTLLYLLQNVKYLGCASSNKEEIFRTNSKNSHSHSAMHHSSHEGWSEAKERDRFVGEIELVEQHFDCPGGQVSCG